MESKLKILLVSDDEVIHNQISNAISSSYNVQLVRSEDVVREVNRSTNLKNASKRGINNGLKRMSNAIRKRARKLGELIGV